MVSAEEWRPHILSPDYRWTSRGLSGRLFQRSCFRFAGVSFIFGANGLGFLLMFLAMLQWKRVKMQSSLPLENFFESLTTAIR